MMNFEVNSLSKAACGNTSRFFLARQHTPVIVLSRVLLYNLIKL